MHSCQICYKEFRISNDLDDHMLKIHPRQWLENRLSAPTKSIQKIDVQCKHDKDDELSECLKYVYHDCEDVNVIRTERITFSANTDNLLNRLYQALVLTNERINEWSARKGKLAEQLKLMNSGISFYLTLHINLRSEDKFTVKKCFSTSPRIAYSNDVQDFVVRLQIDLIRQINASEKDGWMILNLCELHLHLF